MKYRKKPIIIEAVQLKWSTWSEVCELIGENSFNNGAKGVYIKEDGTHTHDPISDARIGLLIPTLEGVMLAIEGDYIIKGIKGEFYPCKPDIFEATYEIVEDK